MTLKRYSGGWNVPPTVFWWPVILVGGYATPGRGGTFYNTYTITAGEDYDLLSAVNNIVAAEQCLLSANSEIDRVIVVECDDSGAFTVDSKARVFWVHDWEFIGEGHVPGLHGAGIPAPDRFCALRVSQGRRMGRSSQRLYYDAVMAEDVRFYEKTWHHHGGIGLLINSSLGGAYFPAYRHYITQVAGLETEVSIDRDGASIALEPPRGLPHLHLASIEVLARQRHACHTADDEMFEMLTHEMLMVVLVALAQYEVGYENFHFLWGSSEIPNRDDNFEGAGHYNPMGARGPALSGEVAADVLVTEMNLSSPKFLHHLLSLRSLFERWKSLDVDFKGNAALRAEVEALIESQLDYLDGVPARWGDYLYPQRFRPGSIFGWQTPWYIPWYLLPGETVTFWYDEWPRLEDALFELQRCFALLQVISYIKPRGKTPKGGTVETGVILNAEALPEGTFEFPIHWESKRLGRGPFLSLETGPDAGKAVVLLGPSVPAWDGSTEEVSWLSIYYLDFQMTRNILDRRYDNALSYFHQLKTIWQIASPAQQEDIMINLRAALLIGWNGEDPDPDTEPTISLG